MRVGMPLGYAGGFSETVAELADFERAGLDIVFVPEAYSFDAVSQLGFIAARTTRLQIASGILPIYSRTPTLTAMTAAGLDYVSGGRFTLGPGTSGPQVIEGWHGAPYHAPIGRTRELIEICRLVWRRERLDYHGKHYALPLDGGTGLGKPLKLINHPVRERIPIVIATLGPKNVDLAAELAEGWQPIFYFPEQAAVAWAGPLAEGKARRPDDLGPLDVIAAAPLAIGDDVTHLRELVTGEGTWLLDVRPADRIEAADRVKFAASAEAALACGWRYGVAGGWQPHAMTTLDTLSAQRRPLSDPLGLAGVLLAAAAAGPLRFADLVAAACYPAVARAFAIHLIWRRVLAIDLAVPFGDSALVWRGGR